MSQGIGALVLMVAVLLVLALSRGEFRLEGLSIILFVTFIFVGFIIFMAKR